ncbi:hypothetical protein RCCS2_05129 [Roseobacter sp. CCS2]|nr:hypothetical protein RCCS2_05129 [Roseobacter sp. CCS2]
MNLIKSFGLSALFGIVFSNLAFAEQHAPISGVFLTELADEGSVSVLRIEPGTQSQLRVGDILQTYVPTGESIGSISELSEIVNREQGYGLSVFPFSVVRNDMMWVVTLTLP